MSKIFHFPDQIKSELGFESPLLNALLDKEFGIVNGLIIRKDFEKFGLYTCQALSCDKSKLFPLEKDVSSGGLGVSRSLKVATEIALSETVERYALAIHRDVLTVDSRSITKNERAAWNESHITTKTPPIHIVSLINHFTDQTIRWPARKFFVPFTQDKFLTQCTSNGTSCSNNYLESFRSSIFELIERHTLVAFHYLNLPTSLICNNSFGNSTIRNLIRQINYGRKIKIYRLQLPNLPPVALSIIHNKTKRGEIYGIGASCKKEFNEAVLKSIQEALVTYSFVKHIKHLRKTELKNISALHEHFLYYQFENFDKLAYLRNCKEEIDFEDNIIAGTIENYLVSQGFNDIYDADITPLDISRRLSLKVCRVVIPKFLDLPLSQQSLLINDSRLVQIRKQLNIKSDVFNHLPHPLP